MNFILCPRDKLTWLTETYIITCGYLIMFTNKAIIVNKKYYDKSNCKFILCDSCWWFATILKDVYKCSYCPRCKKKKKLHIERITI